MTSKDLGYVHFWEPGTSPGAPTLLLLHGTGGTEHDLVDLGHSLMPGAAVLSPRGPVSEHGHARFFRRLAEGVFDLDDLRKRTGDLVQFVHEAAEVYGFDPQRVVAVGFSNGANIAASVLLSKAGAFAGAVLLHPMVPFVTEEVWQLLATAAPQRGIDTIAAAAPSIMIAPWPECDAARQVCVLGCDVAAGRALIHFDRRGVQLAGVFGLA